MKLILSNEKKNAETYEKWLPECNLLNFFQWKISLMIPRDSNFILMKLDLCPLKSKRNLNRLKGWLICLVILWLSRRWIGFILYYYYLYMTSSSLWYNSVASSSLVFVVHWLGFCIVSLCSLKFLLTN